MPQFMLLFSTPRATENIGPEDTDPRFAEAMGAFNHELEAAGAFVDAAGLRPTSDGFRTEYADGAVQVLDGPFTDRDEVLMGYWTIRARDLAEATDWAQKVPLELDPHADGSQIEVRRLFELDDFPAPDEEPSAWRENEEQMRAELQTPPAPAEGTQRWFMAMRGNADTEAGTPPDEKTLAEMGEFIGELYEKGVFVAGEGLKPTSEATRVRYEGGRKTVVDGPFTESKELVAGYSVVQVATRREAEEIAIRGNLIGRQGGDIRLMW
jgi:hypothetical protein